MVNDSCDNYRRETPELRILEPATIEKRVARCRAPGHGPSLSPVSTKSYLHRNPFGDTILVNGAVYPFVDVEPRRYRFRVLNGSNARFYKLKLVYAQSSTFPGSTEPDVTKLGPPFLQIGTEGGFLPSPVLLNYRPNAPTLLLAPAEPPI
jgi:FtsP/CotA-like multicopper oxidase with cupredoxin domain